MYYELLTGQLPFDEENTVTIAIKHIQEELVPPKEILPDIPASVNDIVVKLTHKKPEDRYQNMDELIDDLEKIMVDANAAVGDNGSAVSDETQIIGDEGLFKIEPVTGPIESGYHEDDEEEDDLAQAQRKKKKKIIAFSIAGGILAIILIVILMNTLTTKAVMVPNVKNMTQEQATQELEKAGLKLEVENQVYSSDVESGKIVSQNPEEGREMKKGQTVKVTVSKGTQNVTVPKVIGLSEAEATAAIDKLKLVKNVKREYNSDVATGIVYSVDPGEGVSVAEGTSITLYVSKGQDLVTVPGIVGLSESAAEAQIEDSGLSVGRVTTSESDTVSAGLVISQSPTEGTQTERGTSINFVVSSGKPTPSPTPTPTPSPTPTPKPETPTDPVP